MINKLLLLILLPKYRILYQLVLGNVLIFLLKILSTIHILIQFIENIYFSDEDIPNDDLNKNINGNKINKMSLQSRLLGI